MRSRFNSTSSTTRIFRCDMLASHASPRLDRRYLEGQGDREFRAFADLALHGDIAAQQRHELLCDREPQPGPAVSPRAGHISLAKLLEDRLEIARRDTDPSIRYREPHRPVFLPHRYPDLAILRKFHRVAEQIEDDLLELVPIGVHRGEVGADLIDPPHTTTSQHRAYRSGGGAHEFVETHGLNEHFHAPGFDLRQIEESIDKVEQVFCADQHLFQRWSAGICPSVLRVTRRVKPMIELSGVRSSWLTFARNCDLWRDAASSCWFASWSSLVRSATLASSSCACCLTSS